MRRSVQVGVALVLAAACGAASAQLYRWTDDKGRVHITDTPPPPGARNVQKSNVPGSAPASGPNSSAAEPYALQVARKNYPVTLYSTPGCEACGEARKLLNERGIPFKEVSVTDEKSIEDLKKAVGSNSVPAMIVGATVQKGFEEASYHRILDAAGYPKTGSLPPRNQQEPKAVEPTAEVKPAPQQEEAPRGPYAPGAKPPRSAPKK